MPRLPTVGADEGQWDSILNEFLKQGHGETTGLHKPKVLKEVSGIINVMEYGADNKGVNSSDVAIQNAINSIPPEGGTVFFPSGTYSIASPIIINKSGIRIIGSSTGQGGVTGSFNMPA